MDKLWKDLQVALRYLRKNKGYSVVAIVTLALAIGANTTVFSVVEALLNFPLPMDDPRRVTFVFTDNAPQQLTQGPASVDDFLDWREQTKSFEHLVAISPRAFNFSGGGEPERIIAAATSNGFFPALGVEMALGRAFLPEESAPGAGKVAVLSYPLWQRQFGGERSVIGRAILLDGENYTVVGVTAAGFFFPAPNNDIWVPLLLERGSAPRDQRALFVVGRLLPGVSAEQASAEIRTLTQQLEEAYPATNKNWRASVVRALDNFRQGTALASILLYASITVVLLIACANVANLMLARTAVRQKEIAVRTALGAARRHLVAQLLTESVTLAVVGGVLGFLMGLWGTDVLRNMLAADTNVGFIAARIVVNQTVLLHTLGISVFAGLLFGLAPALKNSRPNLQENLKEGARGSGGRRQRLLSGLVVAQTAMALALLTTTAVLVRSFNVLYAADPGFQPRGLLTFQVALPERNYSTEQSVAFYREALQRLAQLPGVQSTTTTTLLPLSLPSGLTATNSVAIERLPDAEAEAAPSVVDLVVSPEYFRTLPVPIVQGRALTEQDQADTLPVAVVSRAMVQRYWPDSDPIGQRFKLGPRSGPGAWLTVVGVSENVQSHAHSIRNPRPAAPHVFTPVAQNPPRATFFAVRTAGDPLLLATAARQAVWALDSSQPISSLKTMQAVIRERATQNVFFLRILGGLSIIALVMAAVGIYGVISYSVGQRSREIGIRMAVGAQARNILWMVVRQGTILAAVGLALGLLAGAGFVRLLGSQLQGIAASNAGSPATYVVVTALLMAVSVLASYVPARRASRMDPVKVLHYE